jgi:hypothetical protein
MPLTRATCHGDDVPVTPQCVSAAGKRCAEPGLLPTGPVFYQRLIGCRVPRSDSSCSCIAAHAFRAWIGSLADALRTRRRRGRRPLPRRRYHRAQEGPVPWQRGPVAPRGSSPRRPLALPELPHVIPQPTRRSHVGATVAVFLSHWITVATEAAPGSGVDPFSYSGSEIRCDYQIPDPCFS